MLPPLHTAVGWVHGLWDLFRSGVKNGEYLRHEGHQLLQRVEMGGLPR